MYVSLRCGRLPIANRTLAFRRDPQRTSRSTKIHHGGYSNQRHPRIRHGNHRAPPPRRRGRRSGREPGLPLHGHLPPSRSVAHRCRRHGFYRHVTNHQCERGLLSFHIAHLLGFCARQGPPGVAAAEQGPPIHLSRSVQLLTDPIAQPKDLNPRQRRRLYQRHRRPPRPHQPRLHHRFQRRNLRLHRRSLLLLPTNLQLAPLPTLHRRYRALQHRPLFSHLPSQQQLPHLRYLGPVESSWDIWGCK
jgi:hypothetical protein